MSHWPLTRNDITRPAYRSLAQGIAAAIDAGNLHPGDQLPPHREFAWRLGLSVQTVSRAYDELIRAGLLRGEVGRGTFVRLQPDEEFDVPWFRPSADVRLDVNLSMMTPVLLPEIRKAWRESLLRVADNLPHDMIYSFRPRQTMARYSETASAWLARCGLTVPARRILITNGTTPAMFVALMTATRPGDMIACESYTCHTLKHAARNLHLGLRGIERDERGMLPEALAAAAKADGGRIKAVFLLPGGAGPLAHVMDRERREELAQEASRAGLIILESDPTGPVARRPPPMAYFAPESSFYFTGLSKCLAPGLRLGFLVMPESLIEATLNRHLSAAWIATPLIAEIARDWINGPIAGSLLAAQRRELALRNRLADRALEGQSLGTLHGLHRWLQLPETCDEARLVAAALDHGIALTAGRGFAVGEDRPAVRLCIGGARPQELERALSTVAGLIPLTSAG